MPRTWRRIEVSLLHCPLLLQRKFRILLQFFGTGNANQIQGKADLWLVVGCLYDFKLELELLATHDGAQIKLPKLAGEPQARPALIEIHDELETECAPKIRQRDIDANRL